MVPRTIGRKHLVLYWLLSIEKEASKRDSGNLGTLLQPDLIAQLL